MTENEAQIYDRILNLIISQGLLLQSDAEVPSAVSEIVGAPVKGSWWGHPLGNLIFNVSSNLDDHPDIMTVKLIKGKVTFVHRKLWTALFSIGASRSDWQLSKLDGWTQSILKEIESAGSIRADALTSEDRKRITKSINLLEARLLIVSQQIHTESGKHVRILSSWNHWKNEQAPDMIRLKQSDAVKLICSSAIYSDKGKFQKLFPWQ